MFVNGTSYQLSKNSAVGRAALPRRKSSDDSGGKARIDPQMMWVPVRGRMSRCVVVLALIAAISGIAGHALAQCCVTETESPIEQLNAWLATSAGAGDVAEGLPIEQLRAELGKGNQADWGTVASVLVACIKRDRQRGKSELTSLRQSLENWLEELPPPDAGTLAAACRSAKAAYRPNGEEDLDRVRADLLSAVEQLDDRIKAAGPSGDGWRAFLEWETLREELAGPSKPDAAVLNLLHQKYDSGHEGLKLVWFDDVRLALERYLYMANAVGNAKLQKQYQSWLEELAKRVNSYQKTRSSDDARVIGQAIQRLHYVGQAGWLVGPVRRHSLFPNLLARASAPLVRAAMARDIDETEPVRDCILGTDVHASAHTVGRLEIELGDAEDQALIHVLMKGTAQSDAIGYNGPVQVHNTGTTQICARKTIVMDGEHIWALPATSNATTSTTINDIQSNKGRRLVEKFAWKRAARQKSQAECIAARHAEERVNRRMDEESDELVGRAEEAYQGKFRIPLGQRKLLPEDLQISSTAASVNLAVVQAGGFDLSAPGQPPPLVGEPDLAIRVHESMVHNLAAGALAGMLLEDERVLSAVEELLGSLPDSLVPDENSEPWGITFAKGKPVRVSFADDRFKVTILGRKFIKDQDAHPGMNISVTYKIEKTATGFRALRQGAPEVFPPGFEPGSGRRLKTKEQVLRTMLQQRLEKMFGEVLAPEPIRFSGERASHGALVLTQWNTQDGWLVMGWQWEASERSEDLATTASGD